jgi:hypothetical protein
VTLLNNGIDNSIAFRWNQVARQFQTPIRFPYNSETRVNTGLRSWEKHLSEWARCLKAIGGIYFIKKWRANTLQPGLEFDNFKPRLKSSIFKCISPRGDDHSFPKEEVKIYLLMASSLKVAYLTRRLFLSSTFFFLPVAQCFGVSSFSLPSQEKIINRKFEIWLYLKPRSFRSFT